MCVQNPLCEKNKFASTLNWKNCKFKQHCRTKSMERYTGRALRRSFREIMYMYRFRNINNNVTKDRCAIPMDTTVRLGPLKFSLRATIDHHGPSIHSGHYTVSINCCEKTFYCNDHTTTEFGIIDNKNSSTAYVILYELIDTWPFDSNRRVGVWSLLWRWHILSIPLAKGRGTGAETCGLDEAFPPDDLCPVQKLCVNIYINMHFYRSSVIGRVYSYNRSVIHYWWSCTPSHSIGLYVWRVRSSWVECHFLFSLVYKLCLVLW